MGEELKHKKEHITSQHFFEKLDTFHTKAMFDVYSKVRFFKNHKKSERH